MNNPVALHPGQQKIYRNQLVTLEDLQSFKIELFAEIKSLVTAQPQKSTRKWLKTKEVRKLLDISPGTLQTLRDNGTIPHCKIGSIFYYDPSDIDREIEKRKSIGRNHSGQLIPVKI
jgi:hypothetical protein